MECNIDKTAEMQFFMVFMANCGLQQCTYPDAPYCQFNIGEVPWTCKENTTTLCRLLISDWAALYRSATNVNECKDLDPGYKYIHDWEDSCPSEYSFPAVSYHVEII